MPRAKKPKNLTGPWPLFRNAVSQLRQNPKLIVIAAILIIPSTLFTNLAASGNSTTVTSLASVVVNLALIWSVLQLPKVRRISVKDAFYVGTEALVRFLVVALALAVMLIPLILGLTILGLGILPPGTSSGERVLFGLLALILALPTFYWLARYVLALFGVVDSPIGPLEALRRSGRAVKGRFWPVAGRLLVIGLVMSILGSVPLLLEFWLRTTSPLALSIFQILVGVTGLPVLNLYLGQLYQELNG